MKFCLLVLLFSINSLMLFGQDEINFDSIRSEQQKKISELAIGLETAKFYHSEFGKLANLNFDFAIEMARNGIFHSYQESDKIYESYVLRAILLSNLSYILIQKKELKEAIDSANKSLEVYKKIGKMEEIGHAYSKLGVAYASLNDYKNAVLNFEAGILAFDNKALDSLVNKYWNKNIATPDSVKRAMYANLILRNDYALLLNTLNDHNGALKRFLELLEYSKLINDLFRETAALANIGMVYNNLENPNEALKYLLQAQELAQQNNMLPYLSNIYGSLSQSYYKLGDYKNAIFYQKENIALQTQLGYYQYNFESSNIVADLYLKTNQLDSALAVYYRSYNFAAVSEQYHNMAINSERIAFVHSELGDYKNAYKYLLLHKQISDSLQIAEVTEKLMNFDKKIDLQDKENKILKLQAEQEGAKKEQSYYIGAAVILLILAFVFYYRNQSNKRINNILAEQKLFLEQANHQLTLLNDTKDKFFSIIAHDLKNPLSVMINITEILANPQFDIPEEEKKYFLNEVNQAAKNLLDLLRNLLTWANSQRGTININIEKLNIYFLAIETAELFKSSAEQKDIILEVSMSQKSFAFCDENMTRTIFRNLVSNAIKFSNPGGRINISSKTQDKMMLFIVEDSGIGMSDEIKNKLFRIDVNVTTRGTNDEKGTGLGLILCKEFVEKQGGEIWVESQLGIGSKFIFTLPIN